MNEEQAIKYIDNMYQKRMESIETKDGVICLRELKNIEFTDLELAGLILLRHNHFKDNEIKSLQQQLKDKDEKISKIIKYCFIEREDINGSKCDDILEILESNKED